MLLSANRHHEDLSGVSPEDLIAEKHGREQKERDLNSSTMNDFLQRVERRAFLTARMATHDGEEALDIVQDAMLKLVTKYSKRPEQEWGPLFNRILHSRIHDWHRRSAVRNRWRVLFGRDDSVEATSAEDLVAQTTFPEPDHQLNGDVLGERLERLVSQLPLRQQQAFLLRAWEGYSIAQTAHIMKCSEGSVKTHYSRAVSYLRGHLGEYQ